MREMLHLTGFQHCPRCGKTGLENKDVKFCLCPSCGFLYCHNPASAVAAIIEVDGKILATVRAREPQKGMLALPGGFVDYQESLEQALAREIQEEVNLEATRMEYLCSYWNAYRYHEVDYLTTVAYFIVTIQNTTELRAGDDAARLLWLPLDSMDLDRFAFDGVKNALREYQAGRKSA